MISSAINLDYTCTIPNVLCINLILLSIKRIGPNISKPLARTKTWILTLSPCELEGFP